VRKEIITNEKAQEDEIINNPLKIKTKGDL
jgi:hypothetical protein